MELKTDWPVVCLYQSVLKRMESCTKRAPRTHSSMERIKCQELVIVLSKELLRLNQNKGKKKNVESNEQKLPTLL